MTPTQPSKEEMAAAEEVLESFGTDLLGDEDFNDASQIIHRHVSPRIEELEAEIDRLKPYESAIRNAHNGYDPECRRVMENLHEPATPADALRELNEDHEFEVDYHIDALLGWRAAALSAMDFIKGNTDALSLDQLTSVIEQAERRGESGEKIAARAEQSQKIERLEGLLDSARNFLAPSIPGASNLIRDIDAALSPNPKEPTL